MKKILAILGAIAGAIIALLTANAGLIRKKNKELEKLNEEKKDLELKEAVLIERAANAKKQTIKSKKELDDAIKEINTIERPHHSTADDLIESIRRRSGKY